MSGRDWAWLAGLSVLWGGSFFFAAFALREVPPLTIVAARTVIAVLVLLPVLSMRGEALPLMRAVVPMFFIMGLLNNLVPFTLLFWAQTVIPSGLASILNATTPIFSIVIAHFALADERMAPNKAIGVVLGFCGVAVLLGGSLAGGSGIAVLGMVACLGATLSYGCANTFGRRFKGTGLQSTQVALGQLAATAMMTIPLAALVDRPWALPMPSVATLAAILALGVLSTALAYVIFFHLLAVAGAVNVALVTLLVPVSAILLGRFVLGEDLAPRHYGGMALIALGLLAIDGRVFDRIGVRRRGTDG